MERRIIVSLVEGDNAPDLEVLFKGLILSVYDSISMQVKLCDGTRFERAVTPDAVDAELGTVTWVDGDLVRGKHTAEFKFVVGSDVFKVPRMYKIELSVRADNS